MDRKRKTAFSKEEEQDIQEREEQELFRLKRQYRIMLNDRNAILGAYGSKASQCKRILEIHRKEYHETLLNLQISKTGIKAEEKNLKKIEEMIQKHRTIALDLVNTKKRIRELEFQNKEILAKIRSSSKKKSKPPPSSDKNKRAGSEMSNIIEKIENKLENTVKHFCNILSENKQLRLEIESLLKDRKQFADFWEKLVDKLGKGKKYLLELIEQSTNAYDQREEWNEKLNVLRMKSHNLYAQHTDEMRELKRQLDLQADLGQFLEKKCQKRILLDLEIKRKQKRETAKAEAEEELKTYKETLELIKRFVGEDSAEKIATRYLKREEENFALFTYVNELNVELDFLRDNIVKLEKQIEEQKQLNAEKAAKLKLTKSSLQSELGIRITECKKASQDYRVKKITLHTVIDGVRNLFKMLYCSNAPILKLLGDNTEINQHNVLLHMAILETRLSEVVKYYYVKQTKKSSRLYVPVAF